MAGRPTNYRPEMDAILEEELASGLSFEASCPSIGVYSGVAYEWLKEDSPTFQPSFAEAKRRGTERGQSKWERLGMSQAEGDNKGNVVAWLFNMKNRYNWRDKKEVTGDVGITAVFLDADDEGMNDGENDVGNPTA